MATLVAANLHFEIQLGSVTRALTSIAQDPRIPTTAVALEELSVFEDFECASSNCLSSVGTACNGI